MSTAGSARDNNPQKKPTQAPVSYRDFAGVVAILLPAFGYAAAYLYRASEAAYFGVPPELVSLDLKDVVVAGLGVGAAIVAMVLLADTTIDLLSGIFSREVEQVLIDIAVPAVFAGTLLFLAVDLRLIWLGYLTALITIVFVRIGPGAMAGIGIGIFAAIISILAITWCIVQQRHRRRQRQRGQPVVGAYGKGDGISMGAVTRQELHENGRVSFGCLFFLSFIANKL